MINMIETGKNLKKTFADRHIKVNEVCNILEVSPTAVYAWFRGESLPSIDNLFYIAEITGCKVDDLVSCMPMSKAKAA